MKRNDEVEIVHVCKIYEVIPVFIVYCKGLFAEPPTVSFVSVVILLFSQQLSYKFFIKLS
jgi:hypothetical protein